MKKFSSQYKDLYKYYKNELKLHKNFNNTSIIDTLINSIKFLRDYYILTEADNSIENKKIYCTFWALNEFDNYFKIINDLKNMPKDNIEDIKNLEQKKSECQTNILNIIGFILAEELVNYENSI